MPAPASRTARPDRPDLAAARTCPPLVPNGATGRPLAGWRRQHPGRRPVRTAPSCCWQRLGGRGSCHRADARCADPRRTDADHGCGVTRPRGAVYGLRGMPPCGSCQSSSTSGRPVPAGYPQPVRSGLGPHQVAAAALRDDGTSIDGLGVVLGRVPDRGRCPAAAAQPAGRGQRHPGRLGRRARGTTRAGVGPTGGKRRPARILVCVDSGEREQAPDLGEGCGDQRERAADKREALTAQRQQAADEREALAQRERAADEREALAGPRERAADQREARTGELARAAGVAAGRHHRRRHPAIARPPVAAAAVRHQPHDHLPVQLLPGHMIPQQRERLPALQAAVPATRKSQATSNRGRRQ